MYSVVLATMMAITPAAAPDHIFGLGCHGCCGCYGCYGCYGCCGCYGCYGCYGSCYSCYGCYGYTCHGCYGSCAGCYGYTYYSYYSYYPGCCGCCGTMVAPVPAPEKPKLPKPKDQDKEEVSRVTITAPADARLTVDGQPLVRHSTTETFETPNLEPGHAYAYVFRAEGQRDGKAVVRERKVKVRAGETTRVDFSDLYAAAAARVTIMLPTDAKLIVENVTYPEGTSKRTFETPLLEAGRQYTYTMRAEVLREGRLLKQEKRVDVEAGKEIRVEFKELPVVQAAQR